MPYGAFTLCLSGDYGEYDLDAARELAAELEQLARDYDTETVAADVAASRGAVLLAEGDPAAALPLLRQASHCWATYDAAYPVATAQVLIGQACRALGDEGGACWRSNQRRVRAILTRPYTRLGA